MPTILKLTQPRNSSGWRVQMNDDCGCDTSALTAADGDDEPVEDTPEGDDEQMLASRWEGVLATEGEPTGDGRMIEAGALTWEALPIPLRWAREDDGGHMGAVVVGTIDTIERSGANITATGTFDLASDEGREAARQVAEGLTPGVSVDLDDVSFEVRVAGELLAQEVIGMDDPDAEDEEPESDDEGRVVVAEVASDDELMVTTSARVRAATLVATPAFINARIQAVAASLLPMMQGLDTLPVAALDHPWEPDGEVHDLPFTSMVDGELTLIPRAVFAAAAEMSLTENPPAWERTTIEAAYACIERVHVDAPASPLPTSELVAAAAPVRPPAAWFDNPRLDGPTQLTVTEDGRIFGHLATWGTCHTGFPSECVQPPASGSGYSYFHVGSLVTDEGDEIGVGRITLDTGHAGQRLRPAQALAHYDNTGSAVADVRAGEDAHGIWVAGALRSTVDDETVRVLRASPLSGDWRRIGGNLELVAALAVNSPGFPIPRVLVAAGHVQTYQAGWQTSAEDHPGFSDEDVALLREIVAERRSALQSRADEARDRMLVASSRIKMGA